jgi:hypothetical protein
MLPWRFVFQFVGATVVEPVPVALAFAVSLESVVVCTPAREVALTGAVGGVAVTAADTLTVSLLQLNWAVSLVSSLKTPPAPEDEYVVFA